MRIIKNYAKSYAQENWKLAPLRSAPRCALLLSVVGTPNRGLQEFYSARKIPKCQSSSQKFLSSDFSGVAEKSRRNFWRDCHFCKPHTLGVIFSWHYDALAGNVDVLAFAKLETKQSRN